MAIAPIDLQTIFTQVEKVGKEQAAAKEGHAMQQAIQGAHIQRKTEEHINQVNETQNTGEGADKINDKNQKHGGRQTEEQKEREEAEKEEEKRRQAAFKDPYLGNKIDISL